MQLLDWIVIAVYLLGLVGVAVFFSFRVKSAGDMFAAGGQSPWWVSGLSGFMTMFSAGTFVVWGGIAYRYGFVAVCISMCYGVAAIAVGWTLAGHWRRLGVSSAAEFLQLRYGPGIVQFYTWVQGSLVIFGLGGAVYALAIITCRLVEIPEDHLLAFLRDDNTGRLSVLYMSIGLTSVIVLITLTGGLWAVLMTDVLQFIVLTVSVTLVIPLIIAKVGGWNVFIESAKTISVDSSNHTLMSPIAGDFTWWFLLGWVLVHYFKIGGEWAFVQRFTCVPTPKDARKSAFIFGVMYLVSPMLWMLPPIVYRLIRPLPDGLPTSLYAELPQQKVADYTAQFGGESIGMIEAGNWAAVSPQTIEVIRSAAVNEVAQQAYIDACFSVLPVGMIGLMVAAMISATASSATTQLNVYAGAFTTEFFKRIIRPNASDATMVRVGRLATLILGAVVLAGAIMIPRFGTYTGFILIISAALSIPLTLPTVWGLFSRKIGTAAVIVSTCVGIGTWLFVKLSFMGDGAWLSHVEVLAPLIELVNQNATVTDWTIGLTATLLPLATFEILAKGEHPGHARVAAVQRTHTQLPPVKASHLPALICGLALALISAGFLVIALVTREDTAVVITFAAILATIAGITLVISRRIAARNV
jgi:SSS family solute:Na+ symporter